MNQPNTTSVAERAERQLSPCCIATVRNLLDRVRMRHRQAPLTPRHADTPDNMEADLPLPSLHDDYAGELEAALLAGAELAPPSGEMEIRYDDPTELARARRVFALTWLAPLLLVSAILVFLGDMLSHDLHALLRFTMLVMAVPLAGSLAALLSRTFQRRRQLYLAAASANISRLE